MVSILVCYGTGEGQTAKVADRIVRVLAERGHDATARNAGDVPPDLTVEEFDAVLVGASIHLGEHQPAVREFVGANHDSLAARPTAFFRLSMSSAVADETRQAEAAGYVEAFLEETGSQPDRIGLSGGALRYSKYGFLKGLMLSDTDASRDYEYTDWHEVESFAADFAAFVEGCLGVVPPEVSGEEGLE